MKLKYFLGCEIHSWVSAAVLFGQEGVKMENVLEAVL